MKTMNGVIRAGVLGHRSRRHADDMTRDFMRGGSFDGNRISDEWVDENVESGGSLVSFSSYDRRNRITPSRSCERTPSRGYQDAS